MVEGGKTENESQSDDVAVSAPIPVALCLIVVNTAVFFGLPFAFGDRFPYHLESLGTDWGPLVFTGQWWRLLTCSFIHFDLFHLLINMIGLWMFGMLVEREFGKWIFLFFYLAIGLVVALIVLAIHPEVAFYGASGAVVGLAGGVIAICIARYRTLSLGKRSKFALLGLYLAAVVWQEVSGGGMYIPHTAGLVAGMSLGGSFVYFAKTTHRRYQILIGLAPLLLIAAALLQWQHR